MTFKQNNEVWGWKYFQNNFKAYILRVFDNFVKVFLSLFMSFVLALSKRDMGCISEVNDWL